MLVDGLLAGHVVVVAHEDRFRAGYLTHVLGSAGAWVAGSAATAWRASELLETGPIPAALVLSASLPDGDTLADRYATRGAVTLIVRSVRPATPEWLDAGMPALTAPHAGYQVVEALVGLLAAVRRRPSGLPEVVPCAP